MEDDTFVKLSLFCRLNCQNTVVSFGQPGLMSQVNVTFLLRAKHELVKLGDVRIVLLIVGASEITKTIGL